MMVGTEILDIGHYEHGTIVVSILAIYMLGMIAVGVWSSRRIKDTADYIVAGRRLGTFFVTGTLFATWFCAGTIMGGAAQAYLFGNQGCIFDPWGAAAALVIAGLFFNRLLRRGRYLTLIDFIHSRYGRKMGLASVGVLTIAEIGWVGALLVGFGTLLKVFTGMPLGWGIVISAVVVVTYTYMGGMWSVTITDVIQMMILCLGLIIILPYAVSHIGGWEHLFTKAGNWADLPTWAMAPTKDAGYLGYFGLPGWFYYFGAWMSIGLGSIPSQDFIQRVLSARDDKVAVRSSYYAGILYLTVAMIPVLLGVAMFEVHPDLAIDQTNDILPWMAMQWLPPFLAAVFVAAVVAALMSSADSALLAISSMVGYNGLKYIKPDASTKLTLKTTRICVPVAALVATLLALYLETIYMLMVFAWSLILVGLFAPFVAGFFWKKANGCAGLASLIAGFTSWVGLAIYYYNAHTADANVGVVEEGVVYGEWAWWDAVYIASVPAFLISVAVLVITAYATHKKYPPLPLCDMDGNPMSAKDFIGWGFGKKRASTETTPA